MSFPLSAASYQVLVPCFSDIARRGPGAVPWSVGGSAVDQVGEASRRYPARFVCPPSPTHRASWLPASRSNTPPTCCGPPPPRPVRAA